MRAIALTLTLAGLAAATTTCPTFVAQAPAYSVGSIVTYNGANYKLVRTEDNGWIEPSNNYFWQATTETCEPAVPQASNNEVISKLDEVLLKLDGKFKDSRDGKVYKFVKIGGQTWMAQNLNYASNGSSCYGDAEENCSKYGRLYTWDAASEACPTGWHLPSYSEWRYIRNIADSAIAGTNLKSDAIPFSGNYGTNLYGFNAMPNGVMWGDGTFHYLDNDAYLWSSTQASNGNSALGFYFFKGERLQNASYSKAEGHAIRCIRD